jgi:ATP-dependent helicase YprA (DUF1998 family)
MDVFSCRDRVVEDYGLFSRSFTQSKAPDLRDFVEGRYGDEEYWPSPLIQLNPNFVGGGRISQLVEQGLLDSECRQIFRWGKSAGPVEGSGQELRLHLHQLEALKIVLAGGCVILTTGMSSGKSISYILPMVQRIIAARQAGDTTQSIRAIVIDPINALCNSQFRRQRRLPPPARLAASKVRGTRHVARWTSARCSPRGAGQPFRVAPSSGHPGGMG